MRFHSSHISISDVTSKTSRHESIPRSPEQTIINPPMKNYELEKYCNRGIAIRSSINNTNNLPIICLCPPAYHGYRCEKQTQRVSLTVQLKVFSDFRTVYTAIIILIDDYSGSIESYDKINYLPTHDCRKKYNSYLLYTSRPKNISTNFTIRIDIYDKILLEYRASWSFPIRFAFLPVYRMAVQLHIPVTRTIPQIDERQTCGNHGQYLQYVNRNDSFCYCDKGWTGLHCNIKHTCNCSFDSLCLSSNLCLCPLKKFGSRCYLKRLNCPCQNHGLCSWNDELIHRENGFWCTCPDGFSGRTCEKRDTEIFISFALGMTIPTSMLLHFIRSSRAIKPHNHTMVFKKIPLDQDTIKIYTSDPFHILLVEFEPKAYYLSVLQENYKPSDNITSTLTQSERCLDIHELFNDTVVSTHILRRIKLYHVPCQQRQNLACFYDDSYMCICNQDLQQANCFEFNHNRTYTCKGRSLCKNQGRCFYDKSDCPSLSLCVCDECSYGSLCQFSTKGFSLSLDTILGYQIRPDISFSSQRSSIKIVTAVVSIMLILGILNSVLCIITFQSKKTRELGCGLYLLISSFGSAIVIIVFALKFYLLITSQMNLITNRIYLLISCILIEFLIKVLIYIIDWLNACVGLERAIAALQQSQFNKTRSKKIAKLIIIFICVLSIISNLQDPIYRRLINDEAENRKWCIVNYTPSINTFNSSVLLFHFICPFILNIVSANIIIFKVSRQRSTVHHELSYIQHLQQQLFQLKRLLISPFILLILALPRLIISFLSGCMKSPRNPWFFLTGYFISLVPSMLTFIIFILPSKNYRKELNATVRLIRKYVTRRQLNN